MRLPFFETLKEEALRLAPDELLGPDVEMQEGDRLIGTVPEDLQRLYSLFCAKRQKLEERQAELSEKDEVLPAEKASLATESEEASLISKLFWYELKSALNWEYQNGENSVSLRSDWQVVACQCRCACNCMLIMGMGSDED